MAFQYIGRPLAAAIILLNTVAIVVGAQIPMSFCASINTASTSGNHSIYQSDGLCHDFCLRDYAFAIIKDAECWCSDYGPADSVMVDTGECNAICPGFPTDTCGGSGLWGYMLLSKKPAGTKGRDAGTPTPTPSPTQPTSGDPKATPTTAPSPSVSIATITQGGTVSFQTVTVLPTTPAQATSGSDASSAKPIPGPNGLTTGQAVGVAVGVLAFFIILGAVGVFLWLRRKRREHEQTMLEHQNSTRGSSAGILGTPRTEMTSVWDGDAPSLARRSSRLMPHDPRMDPYAANIYSRFDNKSHESINTLRDDQDYSRRVLRTTNPDPDQ